MSFRVIRNEKDIAELITDEDIVRLKILDALGNPDREISSVVIPGLRWELEAAAAEVLEKKLIERYSAMKEETKFQIELSLGAEFAFDIGKEVA